MSYLNYFGLAAPTSGNPVLNLAATFAGQTLTGTSSNESLGDITGGATLIGGAGDDTYSVSDDHTVIVEQPGGGIDTVRAYTSMVLPDNVENMTIGGSHKTAIGNGLANLIENWGSGNTINGGAGNDILVDNQAGSPTTFEFTSGSGQDVIYGFTTGTGASVDHIKYGGFTTFDQAKAAMTQVGADTQINFSPTDSVLVRNTQVSSFTPDNFFLGVDTSKYTLTFDDEFNNGLSLYNPATGQGIWKTNYFYGAQSGTNAYTSRMISGDLSLMVDPSFQGTGQTALGLDPFSISNGVLDIRTQAAPSSALSALSGFKYTSGMITTEKSFAQQYGYFEIRAEVPSDKTMWPAFWLLREDQKAMTEIDVMEFMGGGTVYQTLHDWSTGTDVQTQNASYNPTIAAGMHTFGVLWTKDTISFYLDGVQTSSAPTPADMNTPMYMLVTSGMSSKLGTPDPSFDHADFQVDYVRAYSLDAPTSPVNSQPTTSTPTTTTPPTTTTSTSTTAPTATTTAPDATSYATARWAWDQGTLGSLDELHSAFDNSLAGTSAHTLIFTGTGNTQGYANDLGDTLIGNAGNNSLIGGNGNDIINGGAGADYMAGGLGNDTYYVDNPGDQIYDTGGTDTVISSIDWVLGSGLENLKLTGGAISGSGNGADNRIEGNAQNNVLTGNGGHDTFVFSPGGGKDVVTDPAGGDLIDLSAFLAQGAKATIADGADGVTLGFATGESVFLKGIHPDSLQATAQGYAIIPPSFATARWAWDHGTLGSLDELHSAFSNSLVGTTAHKLVFTGTTNTQGYANDLGDTMIGNAASNALIGGKGNDVIDGGAGADYMAGGLGDDTYYVDNVGDKIYDTGGTDTVISSIDMVLGLGLENLKLIGGAVKGIGNSGNNRIEGNAQNNVLTGGGGNDTFLFGLGSGNDRITDFNAGDKIDLSAWLNSGAHPTLGTSGHDTIITLSPTDHITLSGVASSHLHMTSTGYDYF